MAPIPPDTSFLAAYDALADRTLGAGISAEDLGDVDSRVRGLENQVEHLRALNRALVEYLAAQAQLVPHDFLRQLSGGHTAPVAAETVHCKNCGTRIASDAKACYSCGAKLDTDVYILG